MAIDIRLCWPSLENNNSLGLKYILRDHILYQIIALFFEIVFNMYYMMLSRAKIFIYCKK